MPQMIDLTGIVFERLTVVGLDPERRGAHWHRYWTGPRDSDKRELVVRWLPPIAVGTDWESENPNVIHRVF